MATSVNLIEKSVLTSTAGLVAFTSIPSDYDDLWLFCSVRTTNSGRQDLMLTFNNDIDAYYSRHFIQTNGSSVSGNYNSGGPGSDMRFVNTVPGDLETANAFGSLEIYIPDYNSTAKVQTASGFGAHGVSGTPNYVASTGGLWAKTNAITRVDVKPTSGSWQIGSSFYLYGVSNS